MEKLDISKASNQVLSSPLSMTRNITHLLCFLTQQLHLNSQVTSEKCARCEQQHCSIFRKSTSPRVWRNSSERFTVYQTPRTILSVKQCDPDPVTKKDRGSGLRSVLVLFCAPQDQTTHPLDPDMRQFVVMFTC